MFRARKFAEVPSKREGAELLLNDSRKRQRLEHWNALYAPRSGGEDDLGEGASLLVDTNSHTIMESASLPPQVLQELRMEWPQLPSHQHHQVCCCSVSVPSARYRSGRQWIRYFFFPLRTKILLWQQDRDKVVLLQLPKHLEPSEVLYPFLFAQCAQSLSLMIVGKSGIVLLWGDIELPYESVPLSVQIPLAAKEFVSTHFSAAMMSTQESLDTDDTYDDAAGLMCWSNQGSIWEIAIEDRRIRVRAFEKQNDGFFSGITKTVSQFFFNSSASQTGSNVGEVDVNQPIKCLRVLSSSVGDESLLRKSGRDAEETADMLVLFQDGILERRTFSIEDVMNCSCESQWHLNMSGVAMRYFRDTFSDAPVAQVCIVSMPYVQEMCFSLLVAFVCSHTNTNATVKYAFFNFSLTSDTSPELKWASMLDYEPYFDDQSANSFFEVDTFVITRGALYLVWTQMKPIQFSTIILPQAGQSSIQSSFFSLQGVKGRTALAFGARVDQSSFNNDSVIGSVSFLLIEEDSKSLRGSVCVATASSMQKLERLAAPIRSKASIQRTRRKHEAHFYTGESSPSSSENSSVEAYARFLLTRFYENPDSTSAMRVSSKIVELAAQAALAADDQILDAKASSGLRWEKKTGDASLQANMLKSDMDVFSVTPKLVRYQLEEKCACHVAFIQFLQHCCASVWKYIEDSDELKRHLTENEEKLQAAIALSKFQASILPLSSAEGKTTTSDAQNNEHSLNGKFLLHAIEKTVQERGYPMEQLRLAGYNSFDVFYCEVSKIAELIQNLGDEVAILAASIGESDPTYLDALLESGYAMLSVICTPAQSFTAGFTPTGRWLFTRQVREGLANHISRLSAIVGYSQRETEKQIHWQYDDVFKITDQIEKLGTALLECYARCIPLASNKEIDELRKEETYAKRVMLNPLVYIATQTPALDGEIAFEINQDGAIACKRANLFSQCVDLCEKYLYFEGMVFLVFVEDLTNLSNLDCVLGKLPESSASKRLQLFCKKYEGFDNFLFLWYNGEIQNPWARDDLEKSSSLMMAFLLAHSQTFAPSLHKFMKSRERLNKYRWLTAVSIERYDQVATEALREAKKERRSLLKRKTMASIAKIAAVASPSVSCPKRDQEIQQELVRGNLQKLLVQLSLKDPVNSKPLAPEDLVHACLSSALSVEKEDPMRKSIFLMTLEALETLAVEPLSDEYKEMRADVWRSCIVDDAELWDDLAAELAAGVNEESLELVMRQTLLFKVIREYAFLPKHLTNDSNRLVALTIEVIQELVQREGDVDSIVSAQSQQLLIKTLHLALAME